MRTAFLVAAAAAAGLASFDFGLQGHIAQAQAAQHALRAVEDSRATDDSQDAGVFSQWLSPESPKCVPLSAIGSVSRLAKLTPEQFQFARALYIAVPPVSRELPPGDSGIAASADGKVMIALVTDGKACARFLAPDFILSMLVQVGRGENGRVGEAPRNRPPRPDHRDDSRWRAAEVPI